MKQQGKSLKMDCILFLKECWSFFVIITENHRLNNLKKKKGLFGSWL